MSAAMRAVRVRSRVSRIACAMFAMCVSSGIKSFAGDVTMRPEWQFSYDV